MRSGRSQQLVKPLLLGLVSCALSATSFAAEITTTAAVAPGITYTDNVCLSKTNKQDAWVGMVTPSGSIRGSGRKASFNINGSVQFNTLTDSQLEDDGCTGGAFENREQFAPNINANGSAILIDDWLTLNATGRANQNQISPFIGGGADSLDGNGNTNTFYQYSLSPALTRRLKDFATYNLRYNYREVINTANQVSDNTSDSWSTNLQSGNSAKTSWNVFGDYRTVSFSDDDLISVGGAPAQPREDTELRSTGVDLGYQLNREWQVNGSYGWEWNEFQTVNDEDTDGQTWDLGVRWTPSVRTTVNIGSGERFFGSTPRLSITHERKRSTFSASYRREITFGQDILTEGNDFNQNVENFSAQNSQSPILDERYTAGYTYSGRRANINFIASHSEQTQQDNGQQSKFDNLALTYSPLISRKYTLSGTFGWNKNEPQGGFGLLNDDFSNSTEAWFTNVTMGRVLNERMNLLLNYRYTDQQSDNAFAEFQENRVMLTLNIRL